MNEQKVWGWLWHNAKPLFYVASMTRLIKILVWLHLLEPTDTEIIAASRRESERYFGALHDGAAVRRSGGQRSPPYVAATREYHAWLSGWDSEREE